MSIKLSKTRYVEIEFADGQGNVSVRGLSVLECKEVVEPIASEIGSLFDGAIKGDPRDLLGDRKLNGAIVSLFLKRGPELIAHAVALAADVPDQRDDVLKLPFDVQIAALEQVILLTFDDKSKFFGFIKNIGNQASAHSAVISGRRH